MACLNKVYLTGEFIDLELKNEKRTSGAVGGKDSENICTVMCEMYLTITFITRYLWVLLIYWVY